MHQNRFSSRSRIPRSRSVNRKIRGRVVTREIAAPQTPQPQPDLHQFWKPESKQMFAIIAKAVRPVLGHCAKDATVTENQRQHLANVVVKQCTDAGLKRNSRELVLRRIDFWLQVNDPAKALWFSVADLAVAFSHVVRLIPTSVLDGVVAEHGSKLGGRAFDHFVLSIALCGIIKNSVVENYRTRKEECGTKALRELLISFGVSANGTLASQCFKVLSKAGLICCTDSSFEVGKHCRRWTPAGAAWSIPFAATLKEFDLSDRQKAAQTASSAAATTARENVGGYYPYSIGSDVINSTNRAGSQAPTAPVNGSIATINHPHFNGSIATIETGVSSMVSISTIDEDFDPADFDPSFNAQWAVDLYTYDEDDIDEVDEDEVGPAAELDWPAPSEYAYDDEDAAEFDADDWGPDVAVVEAWTGNKPTRASFVKFDLSPAPDPAPLVSSRNTVCEPFIVTEELRRNVMARPPMAIPF